MWQRSYPINQEQYHFFKQHATLSGISFLVQAPEVGTISACHLRPLTSTSRMTKLIASFQIFLPTAGIRLTTLQWRHNAGDGISNHQSHDCLLNRLFRRRSKKTSKLCVTGLCEEIQWWSVNSLHKGPVTWKLFPFDDIMKISIICVWRYTFRTNSSHYIKI